MENFTKIHRQNAMSPQKIDHSLLQGANYRKGYVDGIVELEKKNNQRQMPLYNKMGKCDGLA